MFNFYNSLFVNLNGRTFTSTEKIERLYCKTDRDLDSRCSRYEENGFASRQSQLNLFLQNEVNEGLKKYVHIQVNSRQQLPEELKDIPLDDMPQYYIDPIYRCPNSMKINIFNAETFYDSCVIDESFLLKNCDPVEKIFVQMYPGGAGMEVIHSKLKMRTILIYFFRFSSLKRK